MTDLIIQVLNSAFNISMPFGLSFGIFIVAVWTIPMIPKLVKSLF